MIVLKLLCCSEALITCTEEEHACECRRAALQAVDAQQVAEAIRVQHTMQQVRLRVKDRRWSRVGGRAVIRERPGGQRQQLAAGGGQAERD